MSAAPPPPTPPPERSAQDGREREWQLDADDLAPVRRWLGAHPRLGGLRIAPLPLLHLQDTYLDTGDWRVLKAGFALRVRQEEARSEITLKGLRSAREDLADRPEITELLSDGADQPAQAAGPVGARLRELLGDRPLRVLFRAQTLRERFAVHGSGVSGEIALDETRLLGPDQKRLEALLRVEVEVRHGPTDALVPLLKALMQSCGLTPAGENKFAAGLRSAALAPPSA